jgi:hypothetical protein
MSFVRGLGDQLRVGVTAGPFIRRTEHLVTLHMYGVEAVPSERLGSWSLKQLVKLVPLNLFAIAISNDRFMMVSLHFHYES